jgi:hypothetical protein
MMNWKKLTKIVVGVFLFGLIVYDVIAITGGGKEASISWFIIDKAHKDYKLLVYAFWFCMGHLFWSMKDPELGNKIEAAMREHYTHNVTEKDDYIKKVVQSITKG